MAILLFVSGYLCKISSNKSQNIFNLKYPSIHPPVSPSAKYRGNWIFSATVWYRKVWFLWWFILFYFFPIASVVDILNHLLFVKRGNIFLASIKDRSHIFVVPSWVKLKNCFYRFVFYHISVLPTPSFFGITEQYAL